jgi:hypothetical protein
MNKLVKYILLIAIVTIFASCTEDIGDFTVKGESITAFELAGPENNITVKINTGALTEPYTFSWAKAESGLGSSIKYTIEFDLPDGDFSKPLWTKASDESGALNKATLTFDELKQIYGKGGNTGVVSVKWNVKAENGSPNVKMGQVANYLKLSLSADGVSDFTLLKPLDKSIIQINGSTENEQLVFDWNDAVTTSKNVTYKLYIDKQNGDFSSPLLTLNADNEGKSSQISLTHAQWKTLFDQNKIAAGAYVWTVKAFSADQEWMNETFHIFIEFANWRKPIYIVGEATSVGWDIANALEMNFISPNVWAGTFELKAGKEFKFFPEKGSWDNGMGANLFTNFIGCTAVDGGNFKNSGTSDGYYFVIVDLNSKTITVSDSPKILGGSVVAGWTPGDAIAMQMVETGVYDTYQYITVDGSGFKFVPQKSGWDGDLGASKTTAGSLAQTDEDNLSVTKDGFYRVRTKMNDFTYTVDETVWGIIGDATPGGWGEDTNMTFTAAKGEYVWKADVTLTNGFIKFRANDDWAINFGDNGANGSLEYGGDNIAVTAGTYHIELILNSATGFKYTITAK